MIGEKLSKAVLMLAPNSIQSEQTLNDIVCVKCYRTLKTQHIFGPGYDESGHYLRHYTGYCYDCQVGSDVIQFEKTITSEEKGACIHRWLIHQMRTFRIGQEPSPWILKMPLDLEPAIPACPVIRTGPGGDYYEDISEAELVAMLEKAVETQNTLARFLTHLIDIIAHVKRKKQHG